MTSRRRFLAGCAIVLLALSTVSGCVQPPREMLRVATLNLAHGRGTSMNALRQIVLSREAIEQNLAAIAACLQREAPDVVALQEADAPSDWSGNFDHVAYLAEHSGYPYRHHGQHAQLELGRFALRYGTALLARRPLTDVRTFTFPQAGTQPRKGFVRAEVEFAGRRVVFISVHLQSDSRTARRAQAEIVVEQFRNEPQPLVMMGDYNSDWDRLDDAVRMIAEALHLDAFAPGRGGLDTYPSTSPRRRIDWILISRDLAFREYGTWADPLSDHAGVVATLAWR